MVSLAFELKFEKGYEEAREWLHSAAPLRVATTRNIRLYPVTRRQRLRAAPKPKQISLGT